MNEPELCKKIHENLILRGINITAKDICNLYITTLSCIEDELEEDNVIEISDLGAFWRKEGQSYSVTFFRPVDRLIDRINKEQ